jgi:uncharacterized protein
MKTFEQATGIQRRTMTAELRTAGDEFALVGYAATFNSWSKDLGGFRERILPGTFARSLAAKADVKCLKNHAPDNILGRTKSGTLTLSTDAKGLKFRCELDKNSQAHKDLYASVQRGDIDECSFAFTVPAGGDALTEGLDPDTNQRCVLRTLKDVDLLDVSVVTYPAYNQTSAGARNHRYPVPGSNLDFSIKQMRKAAQLMARELRADSGMTDFASLMQHAHSCAEIACQISQRCYDGMTDDDGEIGGDDEDLRSAHQMANDSLNVACDKMASARLRHSALKDGLKALGRSTK